MKKLQKQFSRILDRRFITGLIAGILVALLTIMLIFNHRVAQSIENGPPANFDVSDNAINECDRECSSGFILFWGWCMAECVASK